MTLQVTIDSSRTVEHGGKNVVQEISYTYSDPAVGDEVISTAARFVEVEGGDALDDPSTKTDGSTIDVNDGGFIDSPTDADLVNFVLSVNQARPGADGHANAHDTLIAQLAEKNA